MGLVKAHEGQDLWIVRHGRRNIEVKGLGDPPAQITTYDVDQSNGVIPVIPRALLPIPNPSLARGLDRGSSDDGTHRPNRP